MMTKLDDSNLITIDQLHKILKKERERAKTECNSIDFKINPSEYRWWAGYAIGLDYTIRRLKDVGKSK